MVHSALFLVAVGLAQADASQPADPRDAELVAPSRTAHRVAARRALYGLRWREPVVKTGKFRTVGISFGQPAIVERLGVVIVGTGEGDLRALRLSDGKLVWRVKRGVPFATGATLGDVNGKPLVVLGDQDGKLLAVDAADGKTLWEVELEGEMRAAATVVGSRLLVTTTRNRLSLVDIADGHRVWTKGRGAPSGLTIEGHARAIESDGFVYATYSDGYAEAYRLETGEVMWSKPLSIKSAEFADADADPVIIGGKLIVATYAEGIVCLDPRDGRIEWTRAAPAVTALQAAGQVLLASSADGYLWGLSPTQGELVYRTRFDAGPVSRIVIDGDRAIFAAGELGLVVVDTKNGKPLQASAFGGRMAGDPALAGDYVAALTGAGYLSVFKRVGGSGS